jgi:hypothetical protein
MENQRAVKWHQNPTSVILLLVFFFPLGIYFMWKNSLWTGRTRWIITSISIIVFLGYVRTEKGGGSGAGTTHYFQYQIKDVKNLEEAKAFIDEFYNKYENEYSGLCASARNDQLKEKFLELSRNLNSLLELGNDCEYLSYKEQAEVVDYSKEKIYKNVELKSLLTGEVKCW